jgi:hypothetical protein
MICRPILVECPHFDVRQVIFKAADGNMSKWHSVVYSVFWADRVTVCHCMGCSPYFAATGTHCQKINYFAPSTHLQVFNIQSLIPQSWRLRYCAFCAFTDLVRLWALRR